MNPNEEQGGAMISYRDLSLRDLFILKEFFDLILSGDREVVYLKPIIEEVDFYE